MRQARQDIHSRHHTFVPRKTVLTVKHSGLSVMFMEVIRLSFYHVQPAARHVRRAHEKLTEVAQGRQLCLYICKFPPIHPLSKRVFSLLRFRNPVLPSCSSESRTAQTEKVRFIAGHPLVWSLHHTQAPSRPNTSCTIIVKHLPCGIQEK